MYQSITSHYTFRSLQQKERTTHRTLYEYNGEIKCFKYQCKTPDDILRLTKFLLEIQNNKFNLNSYPDKSNNIYAFFDLDVTKLNEEYYEHIDSFVDDLMGNLEEFIPKDHKLQYKIARKDDSPNLHIFTNVETTIDKLKAFVHCMRYTLCQFYCEGKVYDPIYGKVIECEGVIPFDQFSAMFDSPSALYGLYSRKYNIKTKEFSNNYYYADKNIDDIAAEIVKYDIYMNSFAPNHNKKFLEINAINEHNIPGDTNMELFDPNNEYHNTLIYIQNNFNYDIDKQYINIVEHYNIDPDIYCQQLSIDRFIGRKWHFWLVICKNAGVSLEIFQKMSAMVPDQYSEPNNEYLWNKCNKLVDKNTALAWIYRSAMSDNNQNFPKLLKMNPDTFNNQKFNADLVYNEKYLRKFPDYIEYINYDYQFVRKDINTIVVKAKPGAGKTEQTLEYLKLHKDKRILFVNFRIALSNQHLNDLAKANLEFKLYNKIDGKWTNIDKLICQVESLHRIPIDKLDYDIVVFDEWCSIHDQLFASTVKETNRVYRNFKYIIKNTKKAIFLDANMSNRNIRDIKLFRNDPYVIWNKYVRDEFDCDIMSSYHLIKKDIIGNIQQGKRVVIAWTASLKQVKALHFILKTAFPDKKIGIYTSETGNRDDFKNVNDVWIQYDILIYTPAVSAGVSFTAEHFDKIYGIFSSKTCNANSNLQMLRRVRVVKDKKIALYFKPGKGSNMLTREQFIDLIENNISIFGEDVIKQIDIELLPNGKCKIAKKDEIFELFVSYYTYLLKNGANYAYMNVKTLIRAGFKLNYIRDVSDKNARKLCKEQDTQAEKIIDDNTAKLIAEANDINDEEYQELKSLKNKGIVTPQQQAQIDRFILDRFYRCDTNCLVISQDFVKTYWPAKVRDHYFNLRLRCDNSIDQIKELYADVYYGSETLVESSKFSKFYRCEQLIKIAGFDGPFDEKIIKRDDLIANFSNNYDEFTSQYKYLCSTFKREERKLPNKNSSLFLKNILRIINWYLDDFYNIKIQTTGTSGKSKQYYKIKHYAYNVIFDQVDMPIVAQPTGFDYDGLLD